MCLVTKWQNKISGGYSNFYSRSQLFILSIEFKFFRRQGIACFSLRCTVANGTRGVEGV